MLFESLYNDKGDEDSKPNYEYWSLMPHWKHTFFPNFLIMFIQSEPMMLLLNYNPEICIFNDNTVFAFFSKNLDESYGEDDVKFEVEETAYSFIKMFIRAIENHEFNFSIVTYEESNSKSPWSDPKLSYPYRKNSEYYLNDEEWDKSIKEYQIEPRSFIQWAKKKGFRIPEPFLDLLDEKLPEGSPCYLDPRNPHYSAELAAAVSVWLAMYDKKEIKPDIGLSTRAQMEKWVLQNYQKPLTKRYPKIETAIERIVTLVNPDNEKKRGRPLTKKRK